MTERATVGVAAAGRVRSLARRVRGASGPDLTRRVVRRLYARVGAASLDFPLLAGDVADSSVLALAVPTRSPRRGIPLVVGWLATPPGPGSGGHTTMFRMVEAVEAVGHRCVLFLYDRHGGDLQEHTAAIRRGWPRVAAEVRDVDDGLAAVDACVATSWQSAHVLAVRGQAPMRRLYLVQDFEPFFYARGPEYSLAEDTYRFGFRTIALGTMVGDLLTSQIGLAPDVVPFGCDTDVYRALPGPTTRSGVVIYCKPDVARRGYLLGRLALEEFHRRHPEQEIHVYGDPDRDLAVPVTRHRRLTPTELNVLYNQSIAGLALSFTNISLVAEEMLAAGTIPVVNDSPYARADLTSGYALWAAPTPDSLAAALCSAVERPDADAHALKAAASVRGRSWAPAQAGVLGIIEDEIYGAWTPR